MKPRKVKDLMLSLQAYATVPSSATIREALVALSKAQLGLTYDRHHHRAVLVLDGTGRVVGKLTHWGMLRSLEPRLFGQVEREMLSRSNLSRDFIESLQSRHRGLPHTLQAMCQEAARVMVKDAMVPVRESIDAESELTEAIGKMVLGRCQSLLVTRSDEVVGILRLSDLFEEVADLIRGGGADGRAKT